MLLIAVGPEVLIRRRVLWAAWLIALLTVAVMIAAIVLLPHSAPAGALLPDQLTQPIGTAQRAEVHIVFGAGTIKVRGLEDETNLIVANLKQRGNAPNHHANATRGSLLLVFLFHAAINITNLVLAETSTFPLISPALTWLAALVVVASGMIQHVPQRARI